MTRMIWHDGALRPVSPESASSPVPTRAPAPVAEPAKAVPAPPQEPDTTLVDPHPPVVDVDDAGEHKTDEKHDDHEEHEGMTEDEINETPTEEPNEFWSTRKLGIGFGALAVIAAIVVIVTVEDSWRALAGVVSMVLMLVLFLLFPAGTVVLFLKKKMTKLLFLALAVAWVVLFIIWLLVTPLSQTTGPYQ